MYPQLIERRCPAQEKVCKAIAACSRQAVIYIVDEKERLGGRIEFDLARCDGCGVCAVECCGKAIEMK